MDGVHLWGKGGCVVRISQGMPLGVDILRQMSSGRSCCLRFKSCCINGGAHISRNRDFKLLRLSIQTDVPFPRFRELVEVFSEVGNQFAAFFKICYAARRSVIIFRAESKTVSRCQTKKLKTRKSQRC